MAPGALMAESPIESSTTSKLSAPSPQTYNVESFDAKTSSAESIIQSLIKNGGCFLRGAVAQEDLDKIEKDVRPYLNADGDWEGDFFPGGTRRCMGLPGKSKIFTECVPGNPLYQAVCKGLLTTRTKSWLGNQQSESVSYPQLNSTAIISIPPGSKKQELHRDDIIHHNILPEITADQYKVGRDTAIGFFVAGKKTTEENGATRFIPGSHLQASEQEPSEEGAVFAEMDPGDGFLMLASCYHGGSANNSKDQERLLYSCFTTKGYLRQEENMYLACPPETLKGYSTEILKLIGYSVSDPLLGWVDLKDPIELLSGQKAGKLW